MNILNTLRRGVDEYRKKHSGWPNLMVDIVDTLLTVVLAVTIIAVIVLAVVELND